MPKTALTEICLLHQKYPIVFKLTNASEQSKFTHCGVMRFDSEEGKVYLAEWMMDNLLLGDFGQVLVEKSVPRQGLVCKVPASDSGLFQYK